MAQYADNGNSASDSYTAKQLTGSDDQPLGGHHGGVQAQADGNVQARELAENEVVREARRKIIEIMEEDESPRHVQQQSNTGRVRRKNPGPKNSGLSMNDLTEGLTADDLTAVGGGLNDVVNNVGVDLFQSGYLGEDNEAAQMVESMAGHSQPPAEPNWDWTTTKSVATLRGGKKVPVWMVENSTTGMQISKPYRIQAPAERIASILNVTGNANDPRVQQITEDYDEYVSLTRQYRKAKQLHESGDRNARQTGQRITHKLRGIKQRLGI